MTPPGIDPGTVRIVEQRLNQYATSGPTFTVDVSKLVTVALLLFIKAQFTTDVRNILHLNQFTYGHI